MNWKLRFTPSQCRSIAERYSYAPDDKELLQRQPIIQERGHLTKEDLEMVAKWKAARSSGRVAGNDDQYVAVVTRFCLSTESERARIQGLTILDGVSWATASVVLHMFHMDPYPILDVRALWSLSITPPSQYKFGFWKEFVLICRELAYKTSTDMRTLDRALWQFSKENQDAMT